MGGEEGGERGKKIPGPLYSNAFFIVHYYVALIGEKEKASTAFSCSQPWMFANGQRRSRDLLEPFLAVGRGGKVT